MFEGDFQAGLSTRLLPEPAPSKLCRSPALLWPWLWDGPVDACCPRCWWQQLCAILRTAEKFLVSCGTREPHIQRADLGLSGCAGDGQDACRRAAAAPHSPHAGQESVELAKQPRGCPPLPWRLAQPAEPQHQHPAVHPWQLKSQSWKVPKDQWKCATSASLLFPQRLLRWCLRQRDSFPCLVAYFLLPTGHLSFTTSPCERSSAVSPPENEEKRCNFKRTQVETGASANGWWLLSVTGHSPCSAWHSSPADSSQPALRTGQQYQEV